MRLFDAAQTIEALPGTWIQHSPGVEVEIRGLTADEEKAIERRYGVRKVRTTKGGPEVQVDPEKVDAAIRERFLLALIDTRGAETMIRDEASAALYGTLLGVALKVGELARLDGHWGDGLKRQVLKDAPDFAQWVATKSGVLRETAAEDEEGKEGG